MRTLLTRQKQSTLMYYFFLSTVSFDVSTVQIPCKLYIMTERRPARDQTLPQEEIQLLRSLFRNDRNVRARLLFDQGWTLQTIGDAFDPPVRRSTVKYWVDNAKMPKYDAVDVPNPEFRTPKGGYQRKKPISPGIQPLDAQELGRLAPIARQYRSGMSSTSLYFEANEQFNQLIHDLSASNVTTAEIAKASGVTFRAIARRLGK